LSAVEELIVRFARGVDEDDARGVAERAGATVRRRMRGDHADEVTLLLRLPAEDLRAARASLASDPRVTHVEANDGGFRAL
jgi:hypothetical protein